MTSKEIGELTIEMARAMEEEAWEAIDSEGKGTNYAESAAIRSIRHAQSVVDLLRKKGII